MKELSDKEKEQFGHEAFQSFLKQFQPLDEKTKNFLIVIFEIIYDLKNNQH